MAGGGELGGGGGMPKRVNIVRENQRNGWAFA